MEERDSLSYRRNGRTGHVVSYRRNGRTGQVELQALWKNGTGFELQA